MRYCVWTFLLLATCATAETTPHAEFTHPMPSVDTEWNATSLAPFLEAIRDVRILGLGETTHGISEMFAAKRRIIQIMVEQQSVETLVFELSVGEGADLDAYVSGERDDVREILNGLPLWMFRVEEFEELLTWLRGHNLQAERPVRIVGMESQYCDRSIRHVLEFIEKDDPDLARELREAFGAQRIAGPSSSAEEFHHLYQPIPSDVLRAYQRLHLSLRDHFGAREPADSPDAAGPLLREPLSLRASAGGYVPKKDGVMISSSEVTLAGRYDGLWYIDEVRPSTFLPQ